MPGRQKGECCGKCAFYHPILFSTGLCRFNPPVPSREGRKAIPGGEGAEYPDRSYPEVNKHSDWCSKFEYNGDDSWRLSEDPYHE